MKRTAEFVLGLLGGIFGFGGAFFALFIGGIGKVAFHDSSVASLGWSALLASIVGIIGSVVVRSRAKAGGTMMLVAGIWGFISISLFYVLPGLLLIIAGFMGVFRKDKEAVVSD